MITRNHDDYNIPAPLIHWLITGIAGSIIAVGAYMIAWAVNDSAWKSSLLQRLEAVERTVSKIETKVESGILPLAKQRLDDLDRRQAEDERRRGEKP